ncbi:hypothetical protein T492DRAFT_866678, partial [Pavlovales sp. CCMP2436]
VVCPPRGCAFVKFRSLQDAHTFGARVDGARLAGASGQELAVTVAHATRQAPNGSLEADEDFLAFGMC